MLCGQPQIVQKKTHVTPPWRRRGRSGNVLEIPLHADRERLDPSGMGVDILFPNIKPMAFTPWGHQRNQEQRKHWTHRVDNYQNYLSAHGAPPNTSINKARKTAAPR